MNGHHCFGQSVRRLILTSFHIISNKCLAEKGLLCYMKAVGFIYLMSTNLFISLKEQKHLREIIILSFLFQNQDWANSFLQVRRTCTATNLMLEFFFLFREDLANNCCVVVMCDLVIYR